MTNFFRATICIVLLGWMASTQAQDIQLGLDMPVCKMPSGKPLPAKYYKIAKRWKEFSWTDNVKFNALEADGSGYERIDGSGMYNWFTFGKLDIDGNGMCDWFVVSLAPYSSGGDSGVLNTLYLGSPSGWKRFGATIPADKPDGLGAGESSSQQAQWALSSETPLVVMDESSLKPYLIGYFSSRRDAGRIDQKGYHIYVWDSGRNELKELDKWEVAGIASQVYAYFKEHGAVDPTKTGAERIARFDRMVEADELMFNCQDKDLIARSSGFASVCEKAWPSH